MKKVFFTLAISLLFVSALSAKEIYVKVMSVEKDDALFDISYRLHSMGYKTYVTRYKDFKRVYTGPFANVAEATVALKRVRENVTRDAFVVEIERVGKKRKSIVSTKIETQQEIPKPTVVNLSKRNKSTKIEAKAITIVQQITPEVLDYDVYFVGLNAGGSHFKVHETTLSGVIPLDVELQSVGTTYGLEGGYYFSKNIFATLGYKRSDLQNVYFDGLTLSLNYKFADEYFIQPYVGALIGFDVMSWKNYPINSINVDDKSSALSAGIQLGAEIPLFGSLAIYSFYRFINLEHETNLSTSLGEKRIIHTYEQNVNFGIKYGF